MELLETSIFLIDKKDITRIWQQTDSLSVTQDNSIVLEIGKLAFTSNNITYAVLGDQFRYWNFFPHVDGGVLPAWGMAEVIHSSVDKIEVGEMLYGYFPLASHIIVYPKAISDYGFVDGNDHRKSLPSVYNYYERLKAWQLNNDHFMYLYSLFQPLFATSFLLEVYYSDNQYFGVEEVYITSASSKTAVAFAFLLKSKQPGIQVIGITSDKNISFCNSLECYDNVIGYDDINKLHSNACVIADFAGNQKFLSKLQQVLLPSIKKCNAIGLSHWDQPSIKDAFPYDNELFFAPLHAKQKQEEWGGKLFKMNLDKELRSFILWTQKWMDIKIVQNMDIIKSYNLISKGSINPKEGIILDLVK